MYKKIIGVLICIFLILTSFSGFVSSLNVERDSGNKIMGETDVIIKSTDPVNVFITYEQNKVLLCDVTHTPSVVRDPPRTGEDDDWGNYTSEITVEIFGEDETTPLDANITITGCGVDVEWNGKTQPAGGYDIPINPRVGGILIVEVYNEDEDFNTFEDIEIEGLQSSATTSIGNNKKITVETSEYITFKLEEVDGTDLTRAEVHVQKFDYNWDNPETINVTIGDFTEGNGLFGEYVFYPDQDYLDELGYLLISAKMGYDLDGDGEAVYYYSWDVVEIEPNYPKLIFGKISNLISNDDFISFQAVNIKAITLNPFSFNSYSSGEYFEISKYYNGFIGENYIFALVNRP